MRKNITGKRSKSLGAQAKVPDPSLRPQGLLHLSRDTFGSMPVRSPWRCMRWCFLLVLLPVELVAMEGGDTLLAGVDTLTARKSACCLRTVGIVGGVGTAGAYVVLDQAWYAQYDRTPFHWFDDGGEWYLMDKTGHAFNSYMLGEWGHAVLSHCGAKPRSARWVGGSIGLALLTGVEVLDGTSSGWGFSNWDMVANITGARLFIGQDRGWGEQRMRFKLSSH